MRNVFGAVIFGLALAGATPAAGGSQAPWSLIDTDIAPGDAEVWVDGELAGIADRFDGWPELLEVSAGWHRIEFRHPDFRTLRIDLDAAPFATLRLERVLRPKAEGPHRDPRTR